MVAAITSQCSGGVCVATMLNDELKRETMNVGLKMIFSRRFGVEPTEDFTKLRNAVEYFFENLVQASVRDRAPPRRMRRRAAALHPTARRRR